MPSRSRTSGSSSKTAGTRVTRSVWPAASIRRAASARASGSRSRPITRRPGCASSIASVWPARPRVASTRTAPSAAQAGPSSSVTRSRRTGTCTGGGEGPGAAAEPVVLIVDCLSNGPGSPCAWCRARGPGGGTQAFRWSGIGLMGRAGRSGRPRGVGPGAGRSGGAQWGRGSGVGLGSRPRADGLPPPCGAPPGVGEERQVVPRGGGGRPPVRLGPVGVLRCGARRSVPFGTQSRGRRLGPGPGRAAGKAARSGWLAELRDAAGGDPTERSGDHDNVGIPSLSISAYAASCSAT